MLPILGVGQIQSKADVTVSTRFCLKHYMFEFSVLDALSLSEFTYVES